MASANITSLYNGYIGEINILSNYIAQSQSLEAKYQYLIAEVVLLKLFAVFELAAAETAYRLACGTAYKNGNAPVVHHLCRSISDAHNKMLSYNRLLQCLI